MVKREYITYKLIPDVNIKNNQNISIIQSMASTFLKPIERVSSKGIIELANPVSYACMIKGAMQVATGDEVKGKASMKNALMGYLVVKFTPQLFDFLDGLSFFK